MRNVLGTGTQVGYCTNVHGGASWREVRDNLERYALAVKSQVCPSENLGVGLWLSARSAREIIERQDVARFADWLDDHGLTAYTFNGFPHGDFHEAIVKHKVYRPSWCAAERARYTLDLAEILSHLLPEGGEGSISTLPLGWRAELPNPADLARAAQNLLGVVDELERRELETGKLLHLDLEPEPGCALDTADDVCRFFREHLLSGAREAGQTGSAGEDRVRRYLRICHDVCHAAVMFEDQTKVLEQYRSAGILVGKVQISSALSVRFDRLNPADRKCALAQLREFGEERYLHQTVVRNADGTLSFYEDLPDALDSPSGGDHALTGEWRVHFHVPVFSTGFGLLGTTQADIIECLRTLKRDHEVRHFEVETYTWGPLRGLSSLTDELRAADLATGIASELIWLRDHAAVETDT